MTRSSTPPPSASRISSGAEISNWTVARLALVVLVTALLFVVAVYVLYQLQAIIVWTILALFLAVALSPAVNWLTRHGWPRTPSILLVYVVVLLVLSAIVALVLPALVTQVRQLASVLQQPGGLSVAIDRVASPLGLSGLVASWRPQLDRLPGQVAASLGSVGSLTTVTSGTIGSIAALLSVAVLGF